MSLESAAIQEFISHLVELRNRLIWAVGVFFVLFVGLMPVANTLYTWLALPLIRQLPAGGHMIATEVTTPFFVPLKVTAMVAFLSSLPFTLYQIWGFVAPGLYHHEKRMALPVIIASTVLFYCGMLFAYFAVFPFVFGFITHSAPKGVEVMTDIEKYLGFVITMFLSFGVAFETPIVVVMLVKFGIVTVKQLRDARRYVLVGAFAAGAIFTPPDAVSQTLLAVPLWLLYETGIIFAARIKPFGADAEVAKESLLPPPESEI